jgi:putative membrane protein
MPELFNLKIFISSLLYSILGVAMFWISFVVVDKLTPYELWKEIVEKKNQPLATVVAAMCLGIAIIVAAAIHG